MGGRSRQRIFGDRVRGARISAQHAREQARKAIREADAAECLLWSEKMEGFGGPAQPSPTIAQCLNGGYGWLEVMCHRCETRASLPLDAIRRPRETPIWKLEAALKCHLFMSMKPVESRPHFCELSADDPDIPGSRPMRIDCPNEIRFLR